MRALGFEPKKEEIKKMIADIGERRAREGARSRLLWRAGRRAWAAVIAAAGPARGRLEHRLEVHLLWLLR
jgi:hypothetical protein